LPRTSDRPLLSARVESFVYPLLFGVAAIAAWHYGVIETKTKIFPSPLAVLKGALQLVKSGVLLRYTRDSLIRVGAGFGLGAVLGVPLGLLLGWYRTLGRALNPVIQMSRPISPIAWIPVSIVLFGVTNFAAVFLVFLGCFFPIVTATVNAVRNVTPIYIRAGRNFGLSPTQLFTRVIFPASLPEILNGLRIALGVGWLVLVAAEMIAVDSGLGYLVLDARNAGKRYDLVVAGMLIIGIVGLVLDTLLRRTETIKSLRWGFRET
jgi:NitT/TauT family transport system permease protein